MPLVVLLPDVPLVPEVELVPVEEEVPELPSSVVLLLCGPFEMISVIVAPFLALPVGDWLMTWFTGVLSS